MQSTGLSWVTGLFWTVSLSGVTVGLSGVTVVQ